MCLLGIVERPGVSWGNKTDPTVQFLGDLHSVCGLDSQFEAIQAL